jgi:hypothetical protein
MSNIRLRPQHVFESRRVPPERPYYALTNQMTRELFDTCVANVSDVVRNENLERLSYEERLRNLTVEPS